MCNYSGMITIRKLREIMKCVNLPRLPRWC